MRHPHTTFQGSESPCRPPRLFRVLPAQIARSLLPALGHARRSLAPLDPQFVSVTYGAGGTTRALTHDAVKTIHKNYGVPVAAHLTCVDATRAETLEIAESYAEAGVTEIVALRGDPPKGQGRFTPHPEGFATGSVELIEALAKTGKFTIRVGAYPDPHPEARPCRTASTTSSARSTPARPRPSPSSSSRPTPSSASATPAPKAGIDAPIIPGILPIELLDRRAQIRRSLRHHHPDLAGRGLRQGHPRRPRGAAVHRALHRALRRACRRRRRRAAFLHAQHRPTSPATSAPPSASRRAWSCPRSPDRRKSGLAFTPPRGRVAKTRHARTRHARPRLRPALADLPDRDTILSLSGLDFMQRVVDGTLPLPDRALMNFRLARSPTATPSFTARRSSIT
jgi:hypothetical protein